MTLQIQEFIPDRHRQAALLSELRMMQEATDLKTVAQYAAAGLLHLLAGSAAAACIAAADATPAVAAAGLLSVEQREQRTEALLQLAAKGEAGAGPLGGEPGTLAVSFRSEGVRGAVFAERPSMLFSESEAAVLSDFARLVGVSAISVLRNEHRRLAERMQAGIADAFSEGVLAVTSGKVTLLNQAGARLLGIDPAEVTGRSLSGLSPELSRAIKAGRAVQDEQLRLHGSAVSVTVRHLSKGAESAVVIFTKAAAPQRCGSPKKPAGACGGLVGETPAITRIRKMVEVAAQSSSGVLIEGESGAGKEVLAQAIHAAGPRSTRPFVAVLCAAIPRELLESELFGYEPGSFTGASPRGRCGKFEQAQGGTLLLDDVVDMPLDMQAKLLRVLQERVVTRIGADRPRPIDVRIISTSNRCMLEAVRTGIFRADLYYRLNVLNISIPPLRERPGDVKVLAEHFLRKHAAVHGSSLKTIGPEALQALQAYSWPGNVRELEHWIESEIHFVSPHETCLAQLTRQPVTAAAPASAAGPAPRTCAVRPLREVERELYAGALADAAGDISRAARDLGISRGKLYRKLRLYELLPR